MLRKLNTLGSDPEIAVVKDGHVVPAGKLLELCNENYNLIPREYNESGELIKGYKLEINEDCLLYEDGMSLEFNLSPSINISEIIERFRKLLQTSKTLANKYGFDLEILPMIPVTQEDIDLGGVVCARFGCDPDESIYNDNFDPARVDARNHMARYFGGHIHSGMTNYMIKHGGIRWVMRNIKSIIESYDLLVGLPNVIIGASDSAFLRRKVYGRAGRHRIQTSYGWEYRTPDNYIMKSPDLLSAFLHLSRVATFLSEDSELVETLVNKCGGKEKLFQIITNCEQENALECFNKIFLNVLPLSDILNGHNIDIDEFIYPDAGVEANFNGEWKLND